MSPHTIRHFYLVGFALLGLALAASTGCMHRRLTIRSVPDGAMAYVDNQPVGYTPVSVSFVHYGVRTIRLEKEGFESVEVDERIAAPWYQAPPLDFIVENLWPWEIRDERVVSIQLKPSTPVAQQELLDRGNSMRRNQQNGLVAPLVGPPTR